MKAMFDVLFPYIQDLRNILMLENEKETVKFSDLDWRLSLVTACRSRQKIMVPKFTMKLDLQQGSVAAEDLKNNSTSKEGMESVIMDCDYNNMKRLQEELQDALKSLNGRYSKKVFKFIK
uniref:COMM domain-containing protein n=1 Tax=Strombidium inclinatum TaxID=197538 RepID=A0A7S3IM53_9SPIT|mmetsp:Transcript_24806/g.38610  ORF Transcript_24806/g.38610 Transcript_24806/m.38610 type:complete len:120 (+) Transcript_24806:296-655(+)